jgi:hypothetical protein
MEAPRIDSAKYYSQMIGAGNLGDQANAMMDFGVGMRNPVTLSELGESARKASGLQYLKSQQMRRELQPQAAKFEKAYADDVAARIENPVTPEMQRAIVNAGLSDTMAKGVGTMAGSAGRQMLADRMGLTSEALRQQALREGKALASETEQLVGGLSAQDVAAFLQNQGAEIANLINQFTAQRTADRGQRYSNADQRAGTQAGLFAQEGTTNVQAEQAANAANMSALMGLLGAGMQAGASLGTSAMLAPAKQAAQQASQVAQYQVGDLTERPANAYGQPPIIDAVHAAVPQSANVAAGNAAMQAISSPAPVMASFGARMLTPEMFPQYQAPAVSNPDVLGNWLNSYTNWSKEVRTPLKAPIKDVSTQWIKAQENMGPAFNPLDYARKLGITYDRYGKIADRYKKWK